MNDTRKWILASFCLPKDGQKIYYFCDRLGIFRGEFHVDNSSIANPNKFMSDYGILDADDVQYWMPYDHALKDIIPLPPDYNKVDLSSINTMIDQIDIPADKRQMCFSYEIMGEV